MPNILFVCSANKQRSATAADYFAGEFPTLDFDSAGTNHKICRKDGTTPLTEDLMEWADIVMVMEEKHRRLIVKNGGSRFGRKIVVLAIPDRFKYYQKELIAQLTIKAGPLLRKLVED